MWGIGREREVWTLTSVTDAELTFDRVGMHVGELGLFEARGQIDRITGSYVKDREMSFLGDRREERGDCKPAAAKF